MEKKEIIDKIKIAEHLETLEPTQDEFIERRISHRNFAKVIYWLCSQHLKKNDFVYASELRTFMKLTQQRSYEILRDLCNANIMRRNEKNSSLIEFHFVMNSNKPVVFKYLNKAMKTLGLE